MADRIGGWRSWFTLHPAPSTSEQAPVGGRQDDTVDLASATDGRLLDAVGAGSQPAMRELFMRHGVAAYGLACLLTPDEEKAADAVADVFVRLWRRGGRMDHAVDHVRLGLLAMTVWPRHRPSARWRSKARHGRQMQSHATRSDAFR